MKKRILVLIFLIFVSLAVGFLIINRTRAGSGDNVYGWAWSENIGWISFNSTTGGGATDYGVDISYTTGNLSGYAWSENIGWIKFDPPSPYPTSPTYSACLNLPGVSGEVCEGDLAENETGGWARACAVFPAGTCSGALRPDSERGGWDGWIKLRDTNYGVWVDISASPDEFRDWAWGGNDASQDAVIGWISFNCADRGVCGVSDYKAMTSLNQAPVVSNPTVGKNHCNFGGSPLIAPGVSTILNWQYSDLEGDFQTAYEIWLDDDSDFSDTISVGKFNNLVTHSPLPGPDFSYTINLNDDDESDWLSQLAWDTMYYWKARARDSNNNWSSFSVADSFETPDHAHPNVDFSWTPVESVIDFAVLFTSETVFDDPICQFDPDDSSCFYSWTFEYASPDASSERNPPVITFTSVGLAEADLIVQDSSGYNCGRMKGISVRTPLPTWEETSPF